jgi:hypothetical protein
MVSWRVDSPVGREGGQARGSIAQADGRVG